MEVFEQRLPACGLHERRTIVAQIWAGLGRQRYCIARAHCSAGDIVDEHVSATLRKGTSLVTALRAYEVFADGRDRSIGLVLLDCCLLDRVTT